MQLQKQLEIQDKFIPEFEEFISAGDTFDDKVKEKMKELFAKKQPEISKPNYNNKQVNKGNQ